MGDGIAFLTAIKWIAENYNYVFGHLIVAPYFMEIASNVMRSYPHWRVHTHIPDRLSNGFPLREQLLVPNATAMHLVDLGFLIFAGINPVPKTPTFTRN